MQDPFIINKLAGAPMSPPAGLSGCGCFSDPHRRLHTVCARPSHVLAYGYERGKLLACVDCGARLLYGYWETPAEPCCASCCAQREAFDRAWRIGAYLQRACAEMIRVRADHPDWSLWDCADTAYSMTTIGDAPINPQSLPSQLEISELIALTRAELIR